MNEKKLIRDERSRAFGYFFELVAIAALQLVTGLGLLVATAHTLLSVFFVLLSCLSLYVASVAAAYFESIRPRGDRATRLRDILWASSKLRLCALIVDGGFILGATALLWCALAGRSDLAVLPAAILFVFGLRAIFLARDYHQARARELESRE